MTVDAAAAAFGPQYVEAERNGGPKKYRGVVVDGETIAGFVNVQYDDDDKPYLTEEKHLTHASPPRVTLNPEDAPGDDSVVPAPGTVFVEGSGDERRRWVVYRREGRMVSLRVEGTQKHRRVNCDVVYYYEEGAAVPTDDDYQDTCEHSSTREVAQWCAETRVLEAGDDDDDLAALRALKDRRRGRGPRGLPAGAAARAAAAAAQTGRARRRRAPRSARRCVREGRGRGVDVPRTATRGSTCRRRTATCTACAARVVAATLSPAEVARCGKTLSPEKWLEKRIDGELKVTVAGGRVVGNSFVDGAGAKRRQFVVAGDRGGLVRCALCDWTRRRRACVTIADLPTDKKAWRN